MHGVAADLDLPEPRGVDASYVSRWERGVLPEPYHGYLLCKAFGSSPSNLGLPMWYLPSQDRPRQRVLPTTTIGSAAHHDAGDGGVDAAAMRAFRIADSQVGGSHLYATVVRYLHVEVGPRLFGGGVDDSTVFSAAVALTEMAGWMAHDAGLDSHADQHLSRAWSLARAGAEPQVRAHVLGSLSHMRRHLGRPADAVQAARDGRVQLNGEPRAPDLEARLYAFEARAHAALGAPKDCARALAQAGESLTQAPATSRSPWVSQFDEASYASEAARCLRDVGSLSEARRQAERVLALRTTDRTRSRAFGQLVLAEVLAEQGEIDAACAVGQEVVGATQALGSFRVVQQLDDLREIVYPHRRHRAVADFLAVAAAASRERAWLQRWSQSGPQP
jgi:hypothetical protein